MLRWLLPAALVLGACDVCPVDEVTDKQFAPVATYHDDIVACSNHGDCNHLCYDLFKVSRDDLETCKIDALIKDGAWVTAHYTRPGVCAADDDDGTIVVDTGDDGGTVDDCTVDDSCDPPPPPPDDGCDDGSCDPPPDDGGDTGGDDGGDSGDGSEIRHHPTGPRSTPAPRASR
jgi:hypothetical protein